MKKIVTFGEIMLRLSTPGFQRFTQAVQFDATYGGGEANVAVSLAQFGLKSWFVTRLPEHEIGESAVQELRKYGVDTSRIERSGERVGIYFLETGASQRPSKVIYDRSHSAISTLEENTFDWDEIFEGKDWFHWTGITPAISKACAREIEKACKAANKAGVTVSCDLNFRSKLWTESEAQAVMIPLMEYVDVCISNEEDSQRSLGFTAGTTNVEGAHLDESGYRDLAKKLKQEFDFRTVAITLRESFSASKNGWSAMILNDDDCRDGYRSTRYEIDIVDRVGGGDSFAAGLIYGLLTKESGEEGLEYAVAASCLKQTIPGDLNITQRDDVEKLLISKGSGRVER